MVKIIFLALILFLPGMTEAQTRVSINADYAALPAYWGYYHPQKARWSFVSLDAEHEFKKDKFWISGFRLGLRKEGKDIYNGTYITAGLFHELDVRDISLIISGGLIYGLPGIQFDRTRLVYANGDVVGYENISMKRNIKVLGTYIDEAGVIQPVMDLKARRYINNFFVEYRGSIRFAKFSETSSDFNNFSYRESITPMPSFGVGLGFSF